MRGGSTVLVGRVGDQDLVMVRCGKEETRQLQEVGSLKESRWRPLVRLCATRRTKLQNKTSVYTISLTYMWRESRTVPFIINTNSVVQRIEFSNWCIVDDFTNSDNLLQDYKMLIDVPVFLQTGGLEGVAGLQVAAGPPRPPALLHPHGLGTPRAQHSGKVHNHLQNTGKFED